MSAPAFPTLRKLFRHLGFAVALASGLGLTGLATSQSLEGMGKPNLAASWGSSAEKSLRPLAPNRTDIPWFQLLVATTRPSRSST